MDPRRKARIDKLFSNLKNDERYEVFDCEVNQPDGSLMLRKQEYFTFENENVESVVSIPPAPPSSSPSQDLESQEFKIHQITFQADVHAHVDETNIQAAVERTSNTTKIKSSTGTTLKCVNPKHIILHKNKQMTLLNKSLDFTEVSTPTATEIPSEKIKQTKQKQSLHIVDFPDISEDDLYDYRSSPSILLFSAIGIQDYYTLDGGDMDNCPKPQSTKKRDIGHVEEIENEKTPNPEDSDEIPKRKRAKKNDKNRWKKTTDQTSRESGLQYEGKKKVGDVWVYNNIRKERTLKERCHCHDAKESKFKCSSITEEKRQEIFKKFWSEMTWKEKKMYVRTLTVRKLTARKRTLKENSKRKHALEFYLEVDCQKESMQNYVFEYVGSWRVDGTKLDKTR